MTRSSTDFFEASSVQCVDDWIVDFHTTSKCESIAQNGGGTNVCEMMRASE